MALALQVFVKINQSVQQKCHLQGGATLKSFHSAGVIYIIMYDLTASVRIVLKVSFQFLQVSPASLLQH